MNRKNFITREGDKVSLLTDSLVLRILEAMTLVRR